MKRAGQFEVGRDMRPGWYMRAHGRRTPVPAWCDAQRICRAVILVLGVYALLLLAGATGLLPRQFAARTALAASAVPQPIGTVALISPSSEQGPVGAELTVQGSGWSTSQAQIAIGAATSRANCANPNAGGSTGWVAILATAPLSGGSFNQSFTWPASLSASSPYNLCAAPSSAGQPTSGGGVPAQQTFTVRSAQPPTLSLSSSAVEVGQPFTITGNNFYGVSSIKISINNVFNQSVQPDGGGSFIVTVTPTAGQAGDANILAQSPPEGNAPPVLTATAQITVLGAATVTPAATSSPSPSPAVESTSTAANSGGTLGGSSSSGGGGGLVIVLIIAILLVLALIAGAVVFLMLRRRGGPGTEFPGGQGGPGGGDWGGYSGPGRGTGPVPQYGQSAPGNYGTTNVYGASGFHPQQNTYPGQQVGGVSQWDNAPPEGGAAHWDLPDDSAPGPDWQPRPMSGNRRQYEDPSYPPYGAPDQTPVDPYNPPATGPSAPPDPWSGTAGGYDNSTGYPPPGRGGYPPNPARPQRPDGSGNPGGDTRGPGGTNPANQDW